MPPYNLLHRNYSFDYDKIYAEICTYVLYMKAILKFLMFAEGARGRVVQEWGLEEAKEGNGSHCASDPGMNRRHGRTRRQARRGGGGEVFFGVHIGLDLGLQWLPTDRSAAVAKFHIAGIDFLNEITQDLFSRKRKGC